MSRASALWLAWFGATVAAACVAWPSAAQDEAAAEGKRWFIAAGVKNYSMDDIPGRIEADFYTWAVGNRMLNPEIGGIPAEQCGVLVGSEATRGNLRQCFAAAATGAAQDVLFVYLCLTPAVLPAEDGSPKLYLCTSECEAGTIAESGLPLEELTSLVASVPAERKIVFLDLSPWDPFRPEGVPAELTPPNECYAQLAEACTLVSAASPGEKLAETALGRPLLGFCLSNAPDGLLAAGSESGDRRVEVSELWAFIKATADAVYKDAGARQTPLAQGRKVVPTLYCNCPAPEPKCPAGMRLVGDRVCVDIYEAPNVVGAPPVVNQNLFGYMGYCKGQGKRTCENDEWEEACLGPDRLLFGYGRDAAPGACNIGWADIETAKSERVGSRPLCVNGYGLYDMIGNVGEYVGHDTPTADVRGGSFRNGEVNRVNCRTGGPRHSVEQSDHVGVRCCADPSH